MNPPDLSLFTAPPPPLPTHAGARADPDSRPLMNLNQGIGSSFTSSPSYISLADDKVSTSPPQGKGRRPSTSPKRIVLPDDGDDYNRRRTRRGSSVSPSRSGLGNSSLTGVRISPSTAQRITGTPERSQFVPSRHNHSKSGSGGGGSGSRGGGGSSKDLGPRGVGSGSIDDIKEADEDGYDGDHGGGGEDIFGGSSHHSQSSQTRNRTKSQVSRHVTTRRNNSRSPSPSSKNKGLPNGLPSPPPNSPSSKRNPGRAKLSPISTNSPIDRASSSHSGSEQSPPKGRNSLADRILGLVSAGSSFNPTITTGTWLGTSSSSPPISVPDSQHHPHVANRGTTATTAELIEDDQQGSEKLGSGSVVVGGNPSSTSRSRPRALQQTTNNITSSSGSNSLTDPSHRIPKGFFSNNNIFSNPSNQEADHHHHTPKSEVFFPSSSNIPPEPEPEKKQRQQQQQQQQQQNNNPLLSEEEEENHLDSPSSPSSPSSHLNLNPYLEPSRLSTASNISFPNPSPSPPESPSLESYPEPELIPDPDTTLMPPPPPPQPRPNSNSLSFPSPSSSPSKPKSPGQTSSSAFKPSPPQHNSPSINFPTSFPSPGRSISGHGGGGFWGGGIKDHDDDTASVFSYGGGGGGGASGDDVFTDNNNAEPPSPPPQIKIRAAVSPLAMGGAGVGKKRTNKPTLSGSGSGRPISMVGMGSGSGSSQLGGGGDGGSEIGGGRSHFPRTTSISSALGLPSDGRSARAASGKGGGSVVGSVVGGGGSGSTVGGPGKPITARTRTTSQMSSSGISRPVPHHHHGSTPSVSSHLNPNATTSPPRARVGSTSPFPPSSPNSQRTATTSHKDINTTSFPSSSSSVSISAAAAPTTSSSSGPTPTLRAAISAGVATPRHRTQSSTKPIVSGTGGSSATTTGGSTNQFRSRTQSTRSQAPSNLGIGVTPRGGGGSSSGSVVGGAIGQTGRRGVSSGAAALTGGLKAKTSASSLAAAGGLKAHASSSSLRYGTTAGGGGGSQDGYAPAAKIPAVVAKEFDSGYKGGDDKVMVCVRVRPDSSSDTSSSNSPWYVDESTSTLTALEPPGTSSSSAPSSGKTTPSNGTHTSQGTGYRFDSVVTGSGNETVYEKAGRGVVLSAMDGFDGLIFAYGQTASGKTFTLTGSNANPGIIPQSVAEIFAFIRAHPHREFLLRASYLEIYNEQLKDLLNPEMASRDLKIRQDDKKHFFVHPLREEVVTSEHAVAALLARGEGNRHIGTTDFNARSSRSHTVFQMVIESRERMDLGEPNGGGRGRKKSNFLGSQGPGPVGNKERLSIVPGKGVQISKLSIIDLAGSERATSQAERRAEGAFINKSLLTLEKVISALTERNAPGHIPFRDSKLTQIIQPSLSSDGGRVSVICTISPTATSKEESKSTLKVGGRMKKVVLHTEKHEILDEKALITKYRQTIAELQWELEQAHSGSVHNPVSSGDEYSPRRSDVRDQKAMTEIKSHIAELQQLFLTSTNVDKPQEQEMVPRPVSPVKPGSRASIEDALEDEIEMLRDKLGEKEDFVEAQHRQIADLQIALATRTPLPPDATDSDKDSRIAFLEKKVQELETIVANTDPELDLKRTRRAADREWKGQLKTMEKQLEDAQSDLQMRMDWEKDMNAKLDEERKRSKALEKYIVTKLESTAEFRLGSKGRRGRRSVSMSGPAVDLPSLPSLTHESPDMGSRASFVGLDL